MTTRLFVLVALTMVTAALSAAMATAAHASGVSFGTVSGKFFTKENIGVGEFTATPADTPVFSQTFPEINFNPPEGTVPCTNNTGINPESRPFTDVILEPSDFCSTIAAEGNGEQAGVGNLFGFQAVFTTNVTVAAAGEVKFAFFSDDGWTMGIGTGPGSAQPTYVSGSLVNPPSSSPFQGYQIVGAYNEPSPPTEREVTVDFPAAGTYPVEIDYTECCGGQLSLTVQANGETIPPEAPHWYSDGKPLNEGESIPVKVISGGEARTVSLSVPGDTIACNVLGTHSEIIDTAPMGGGAGTDEVRAIKLALCHATTKLCYKSNVEIVPLKLPWLSHLVAGTPVRDVIEGVEIEVRCSNGKVLDTYKGTLMPAIGNSVAEFGPGSGELEDGAGNKATVGGFVKLVGPVHDKIITAN